MKPLVVVRSHPGLPSLLFAILLAPRGLRALVGRGMPVLLGILVSAAAAQAAPLAYITNEHSNNVSVIDTATHTVTTTVAVGDGPFAFGQFIGPPAAAPITIEAVIALFDQAVANGTLVGQGPGSSAQGRLVALRNMLVEAALLLAAGDTVGACRQLQDVVNRTD